MRVLLVTGKGGVGKTSVAAATAVRAAGRGARTLVLSTDPAHSLADALETPLDGRPRRVAPRLHALEVDARARLETHWRRIQEYLIAALAHGGVDELEAEELSVLPGLEEIFALIDVREHAAADRHDLLVVDCAPTAETLRLLSLPQALGWYLHRLAPLGRAWDHVVRPLLRGHAPPSPEPQLLSALGELHRTLEQVRELLIDPDRTTVRLVVNPERVVVAEGRRLLGHLALFGYAVDAVILNRLLPPEVDHPFFADQRARQDELLDDVGDGFAGVPVLTAPLVAREPVGVERLATLADLLYDEVDEQAVLHRPEPLRVEPCGTGWTLRLALPFVTKGELDVLRRGDELLVHVGASTRTVLLPAALRRGTVTGARLRDGELLVQVSPPGSARDHDTGSSEPDGAPPAASNG